LAAELTYPMPGPCEQQFCFGEQHGSVSPIVTD
jgi:hypothetical protein